MKGDIRQQYRRGIGCHRDRRVSDGEEAEGGVGNEEWRGSQMAGNTGGRLESALHRCPKSEKRGEDRDGGGGARRFEIIGLIGRQTSVQAGLFHDREAEKQTLQSKHQRDIKTAATIKIPSVMMETSRPSI